MRGKRFSKIIESTKTHYIMLLFLSISFIFNTVVRLVSAKMGEPISFNYLYYIQGAALCISAYYTLMYIPKLSSKLEEETETE